MSARCSPCKKRVLGPEHPGTLATTANLALSLSRQGKHAEAEQIYREALAVETRVLGPEHPGTLNTARNLAVTLFDQRKYAEAQPLCAAALEVQRRVLGPAHPHTLTGNTANLLDQMRSHMRAAQPAAAAGTATRGAARRRLRGRSSRWILQRAFRLRIRRIQRSGQVFYSAEV